MQNNHRYMIPKAQQQVTLRVHPEGRVSGSLFLSLHTKHGSDMEDPCAVLNEAAPFVVLQRAAPEEQFAKLHLKDGSLCLVKKAYSVCVLHLTAQPGIESGWLPEAAEIGETPA